MNFPKCFLYASLLLLAALRVTPSFGGQDRPTAPAIVTRYCSGCHGLDGRSELPYIPRLAGLHAAYIENKLTSFREVSPAPVDEAFDRVIHGGSARKNPGATAVASMHMVGVAKAISAEDTKAAARWYAAQAPAHGRGESGKVTDQGRSLFADGLQSQGLTACQSCHGSGAQGTDTAPRLAGQSASYIVDKLAFYRMAADASSPMTDIARRVGEDQARAVALYLQSQ